MKFREKTPDKALQGTFDPPAVFVAAKSSVASNAPELGRYAPNSVVKTKLYDE